MSIVRVVISHQTVDCHVDVQLTAFFELMKQWFDWSQKIHPRQRLSFSMPHSIKVCLGDIPGAHKTGRDWIICGFTSAHQKVIVIHNELSILDRQAVMFHEFFHLFLNGEAAVHRSALLFLYKLWFHYSTFKEHCKPVPSRAQLKTYLDLLARTSHYFGLDSTEVNAIFDIVKGVN